MNTDMTNKIIESTPASQIAHIEKKIIKIKKTIIGKSFKLIDFHIYDDTKKDDGSDDSDQDQPKYKSARDESKFIIQMFGIGEKGDTCSIYIQDFQPFFYIKCADNWTQQNANILLSELQTKAGKYHQNSIVSAELVEYHKLYGFTGGKKHKFVKVVFKNQSTMNKVKNFWYEYKKRFKNSTSSERILVPLVSQDIDLELYESTIPPLLRYFHINNISPSGWVFIPTQKVGIPLEPTTTCTFEYICNLSDLKPQPLKETRVPYKICSFDIEASSSHGDFPIPIKTYKRLATNLVDVYHKQLRVGCINDLVKGKQLLEKIILTAFGLAKCDDVDLVYPKHSPSKEKVRDLIRILLDLPLEKAKLANKEEDNSRLMTIESIFEQMKEDAENQRDRVGCADGDDDDADEIDEEAVLKYSKKPSKKSTIQKSNTITDLLASDEHSRDEQIQILNDVMTRLFPQLEGDKVTFIGSTFMRYGEAEPYLNHCVVLNSCDPIDNIVIETVRTETDLLLKWAELIQQENPDIIIGYNIFGFDYEFMFRRAQENHCDRMFLQLSRKIDEICAKESKETRELSIENTKIVLATGEYDLRFVKMTGRLQIDMYTYFRRDFNLSSYKLDDVAGQYISDDIKKVNHIFNESREPITELVTSNIMGLHIGDFIHIEITGFTTDYYKDGQKFKICDIQKREILESVKGKEQIVNYNIICIQGHEHIDYSKSIKWNMAKDDVSPQDIFRLTNGSSADRAIVAKYCIQDCNLVHHLMNKIDVLTGYVEMSKICSVPISFLVFRGQGIKLTSYVAKKCREKHTLMPDLEKNYQDHDGYEGAIVLPPKCSMYMDNPVACVDYASLYPSSMISQNYSHDSKVCSTEYNLSGKVIKETGEKVDGRYIYDNLPEYQYVDIEFDTFKYLRNPDRPAAKAVKTKVGKKVCRWAQLPNGQKSIMPAILEELLRARADTRKLIKTEKDPFMQNILDKRQLGYKVTANSLYGQCGAKTSTFYEKDVAAATTATGRMMITYAKRIIEEVYGDMEYDTGCMGPVLTKAEYVYGDSVANYTPIYVRFEGKIVICTIDELANKYGRGLWSSERSEYTIDGLKIKSSDCPRALDHLIPYNKYDKEFCELQGLESWTESGWTPLYRVIRHQLAPHKKMIRIMTSSGLVDVTDDHSLLLPDGQEISPNDVKFNTELLHCQLPEDSYNIEHFPFDINYSSGFSSKNHLVLAKVCAYVQSQGQYISLFKTPDSAFALYFNESEHISSNTIKYKAEIPYEGYVYDLTTENHHFAAGVGNLIVHNTDSVFFTFNLQDPKTGEPIRGAKALEATIEIAQDAAHLCTQWLKPPMELTYEKTLMPFILLSKKRYVGMLYETDPTKGKMKYMGLSLKRRDSCDYLKDTYGGVLNILMKENNIQKAMTFLEQSLGELTTGNVPMDKLTITKALRGYYKNPGQIAHAVLADRIAKRDPGNKPKPGDRMKFVHIVSSDKKALQGEKIETPDFITQERLALDYTFYITNQLMKPLQQLFGLALEQIWSFQNKTAAIKTYKKDICELEKENDDLEIFMKKKEKYCSAKVKVLLFDKVLTKINNDKQRLQPITSFFMKK